MSISAIVLAGDREASKSVFGQNKALLDMHGRPVLFHVLTALDQARQIDRIFIVGPKERLTEHVNQWTFNKPVTVLEQQANIYENAWIAFLHSIPGYDPERPDSDYENEHEERAVLMITGDIPLLVSAEVDHFILHADTGSYDMIYGISTEEVMQKFYPTGTTPGIRMAYFYMREFVVRHSNMIVIKPFKVKNREYIRMMYSMRYQKSVLNILKLIWTLISVPEGTLGIIYDYIVLQISLQFARLHLRPLTRQLTSIARLCRDLGILLGTRFWYVINPLGGAAMDTDNETDYTTMRTMFEVWKKEQVKSGTELDI